MIKSEAPVVVVVMLTAPLNDVVWSALKVAAVEPPVAIVITSEPLKVIDVFESASPLIESSDKLPTLDMF